LLDDAGAGAETLRDWFQACPIEARERLRDRTDRVKRTLEALLTTHRKKEQPCDFPVVLVNERGEGEWSRLSVVSTKDFNLAYRTIVLPVEVCGLNTHGALDAKAYEATSDVTLDVAEATAVEHKGERRERWLLIRDADSERYGRLVTGETAEPVLQNLSERERVILKQPPEGDEEGGEWRYLVLMVTPKRLALESPETSKTKQTLDDHTRRIVEHIGRIADALGHGLSGSSLKEALVMAVERHDGGKNRPLWQRYACNPDANTPLAKSTKYLHGRALGGYRHEFGSLLEAGAEEKVQRHSEADLILHLIAAHHGWARPHFELNAWDQSRTTAENEQAVADVMRRFGRLQQRFGRWGLAWLEALLRCADIAASRSSAGSLSVPQRREVKA
jgi:CRISPR-associated endonuclease/helicase Cas3